MEAPGSAMAPLLLRNLLTSIFLFADKPLFYFSQKFHILHHLRSFIASVFLFFLSLLPYFFSSLTPIFHQSLDHSLTFNKDDSAAVGGPGVSRALSQLLLIMNDIPVSSRKYEVVRSLAEKLIDENLLVGNRALREINCAVLSTAFARSLSELEAATAEHGRGSAGEVSSDCHGVDNRASRLLRGIRYYGSAAWQLATSGSEVGRSRSSAEKLAAELLWLAQKMAASGCIEEAVCKWASASNLAWLALSTEPRLQCSLVKVSALLIKQAKDMGIEGEVEDVTRISQHRQTKMKILMSWLPLLCRANNGTDTPILSMAERAELERILEEIIGALDEDVEQEMVLSLWLHHFTYCSSSDWPNLRSCYTRWYSGSRARLVEADQAAASSLLQEQFVT